MLPNCKGLGHICEKCGKEAVYQIKPLLSNKHVSFACKKHQKYLGD